MRVLSSGMAPHYRGTTTVLQNRPLPTELPSHYFMIAAKTDGTTFSLIYGATTVKSTIYFEVYRYYTKAAPPSFTAPLL